MSLGDASVEVEASLEELVRAQVGASAGELLKAQVGLEELVGAQMGSPLEDPVGT